MAQRPRAGIVVTGTEVLTGRVSDRNGPWLAEQLRVAGVDVAQVIVVGDRRDDLVRALEFLRPEVALILTTGGLGPTADDLTAEVVGQAQGRVSQLDPELEARIAAIVAGLMSARGWRLDPEATAAATRKQALVPVGATVLAPVGTAPGLIVPPADGRSGPPIVVLPGPPRELQGMWPAVLGDPVVTAAIATRSELRQSTLRLWGTPESELAATLRELEPGLDGLEITTCLRDGGELEIVTRYGPDAGERYTEFAAAIQAGYPGTLFSADGRTIDELIAAELVGRGLTIATAESCTAGLLAGRLTDRPGSSAYVLGGLVVYSNAAKTALAGVDAELIERVGAVSAEVAVALAEGARQRLGADIGVGITGIAGPGGGSPDKPVGLVHLCLIGPDRAGAEQRRARVLQLPGSRADVRARAVTVALHLVRQLLIPAGEPTPPVTSTLLTGIGLLATQHEAYGELIAAAVVLDGEQVAWLGSAASAPAADERVELAGASVLPGFVDSHAHLVFAGDRTAEFSARMAGIPYTAGGIQATVTATRAASDDGLRANLAGLAAELLRAGVTTFECKSGYGLDIATEARSLRLAAEFTAETTFLGAHVVPGDVERGDYLAAVTGPMLDACAPSARWVDVFCERGAFDVDESRAVLRAGLARGLGARVHANQLTAGGGVQLAVEVGAASADHCTHLSRADVDALGGGTTVATLLPLAEFSTRSPYPSARRLLDAGATVALATDCNPGSAYSTSMPLAIALAVREMGLTPAEAVYAATRGGARALRRSDVGYLAPGARADLLVLAAPSYVHLAYRPGVPLVSQVWQAGHRVV